MRRADIVVVGGGHNGLIAAAYLARAGRDVIVLEQNDAPGGALMSEDWDGHRIERGALEHTAIRATGIVDELDLPSYGLEYRVRPVPAVHLFGDGARVVIDETADGTAASIGAISSADARAWLRLVELSSLAMQALSVAGDGWLPPWRLARRVARLAGGRRGRHLLDLVEMPVVTMAERWFESAHLRALAVFRAQFLGLPPTAPGTAAAFLYTPAGHGRGVGRPVGGSRALTTALVRCIEAAGGIVECGRRVSAVSRSGDRWVVRSDDTVISCRSVVSAMPPQELLLHLVQPPDVVPSRVRRRLEAAPIVVGNVSQWTLSGALATDDVRPRFGRPELDEASLWILRSPGDAPTTYDEIAAGRMPEAPGSLLAFPSVMDPSSAPAGRATFWINGFAPRLVDGRDWDAAAQVALARSVWRTIRSCVPGVEEAVTHLVTTDPAYLAARLGAETPGNHTALMPPHLLGSRPARGLGNYRTPIDGLYLCGAGTSPGGGLNGTSGRAVARAVLGRRSPVRRQLRRTISLARTVRRHA
jgi:phytoene dehydrogenase-like protein